MPSIKVSAPQTILIFHTSIKGKFTMAQSKPKNRERIFCSLGGEMEQYHHSSSSVHIAVSKTKKNGSDTYGKWFVHIHALNDIDSYCLKLMCVFRSCWYHFGVCILFFLFHIEISVSHLKRCSQSEYLQWQHILNGVLTATKKWSEKIATCIWCCIHTRCAFVYVPISYDILPWLTNNNSII